MVDAVCTGDLAVVGERAQGLPEVGPAQDVVRRDGERERDPEGDQLRDRKRDVADEEGARRVGVLRGVDLAEVGAPDVVDQLDRNDEEAEAEEQRAELVHLEAVDHPLDRHANDEHRGNDDQRRQQGVDAGGRRDLVRDVGAAEDEGEVREVDHLEQAPGEREPKGHHRVESAGHDAGHPGLQVGVHPCPTTRCETVQPGGTGAGALARLPYPVA